MRLSLTIEIGAEMRGVLGTALGIGRPLNFVETGRVLRGLAPAYLPLLVEHIRENRGVRDLALSYARSEKM